MTVWPFFPNWKSRYSESYEYATEIIVSDSGREQRRAWIQAARRSVSYRALVNRDRMRALRRTLANRGGSFEFPDEVRRARVVSATTTSATFDAAPPDWLATGRRVVFEDRATREREVRVVDSVSGVTVAFTAPSARTWAAGTRVMPALTGTLAPTVRTSAHTDDVFEMPVELDVEPGTEFETVGLPAHTFGGLEVLTHRPDWSDRVEFESVDPTIRSDMGFGVRSTYRAVPFTTEITRRTHLVWGADQLNQTLGLFQRSRGRQGEFYVPSWTNDISLAAPTAAGSSVFVVAGHDFFDAYATDTVRRCFMVRMAGGSLLYFRIASMAKSTSGDARTLITTTVAAPADIDPVTLSAICWMPVCRFASDTLTVSWVTDTTADITMNLQALEDRP